MTTARCYVIISFVDCRTCLYFSLHSTAAKIRSRDDCSLNFQKKNIKFLFLIDSLQALKVKIEKKNQLHKKKRFRMFLIPLFPQFLLVLRIYVKRERYNKNYNMIFFFCLSSFWILCVLPISRKHRSKSNHHIKAHHLLFISFYFLLFLYNTEMLSIFKMIHSFVVDALLFLSHNINADDVPEGIKREF